MKKISIRDDHIKLGQLLKLAGLVDSGLEAKIEITEGRVKLNNITELQRGKKVFKGDIVSFKGEEIRVL